MARPEGFARSVKPTLCGNRNDFGAFHFQNLLVVEPFVALQLLSGSHPLGDKLKTGKKAGFEFMARPEGFEPSTF